MLYLALAFATIAVLIMDEFPRLAIAIATLGVFIALGL